MSRALDMLAGACRLVTGVALVVLTAIFGWLVYGRYVLNATPTWVEQVSLLLVVLITFVGAAVGIHERTHLAVTLFRDRAPTALRRALEGLSHAILAGFGAVMASNGYQLAAFKWGSEIPLLGIAEGWRAVPLLVCGVLVCLFSLAHLARCAFPKPGS